MNMYGLQMIPTLQFDVDSNFSKNKNRKQV